LEVNVYLFATLPGVRTGRIPDRTKAQCEKESSGKPAGPESLV